MGRSGALCIADDALWECFAALTIGHLVGVCAQVCMQFRDVAHDVIAWMLFRQKEMMVSARLWVCPRIWDTYNHAFYVDIVFPRPILDVANRFTKWWVGVRILVEDHREALLRCIERQDGRWWYKWKMMAKWDDAMGSLCVGIDNEVETVFPLFKKHRGRYGQYLFYRRIRLWNRLWQGRVLWSVSTVFRGRLGLLKTVGDDEEQEEGSDDIVIHETPSIVAYSRFLKDDDYGEARH